MGKNQHVVKNDDHWSVKGEGNERATKNHDTQEEAIQHASEIAQNQDADVIIHKEDGKIRARKSFSNDSDKSIDDINNSNSKKSASQKSPKGDNNSSRSLWQRIKSIWS